MAYFINHTNHPSSRWSEAQKAAARAYGQIKDLPFPEIPPEASSEEVHAMAGGAFQKIMALHPAAVLCQGEFTYSYALIRCLEEAGVPVVAACSARNVKEWVEQGESRKSVVFHFVQFRRY